MENQIEKISCSFNAVEITNSADGKQILKGVALPYGEVEPFNKDFSLTYQSGCMNIPTYVLGLYEHERNHVLASTNQGTLRIANSDKELTLEMDPPTFDAAAMDLINSGKTKGLSVTTINNQIVWSKDNGRIIAKVVNCDLDEISVTDSPRFSTSLNFETIKNSLDAELQPPTPEPPAVDVEALQQQLAILSAEIDLW
jgi:hypothetical protein